MIALVFILYSVILIVSSAMGGSRVDGADPPSNGLLSSSHSPTTSSDTSSSSSSANTQSAHSTAFTSSQVTATVSDMSVENHTSAAANTTNDSGGGVSYHFFEFTICAWRAIPIMVCLISQQQQKERNDINSKLFILAFIDSFNT